MSTRPARIADYPSKPAVRRALALARELNLDPVGIEMAPGGVIRILDRAAFPAPPRDEFEQWEQSGKLG